MVVFRGASAFRATEKVTDPFPAPLPEVIVTQDAPAVAGPQEHPLPAVTLKLPEDVPLAGKLIPPGEMEYVQPDPWCIAKEALAMVMDPSRARPVLAATE